MILRIVKMSFPEEQLQEFIAIFNEAAPLIRQSKGCIELSLLQEDRNPSILATLSKWNSVNDLESYRQSELFKTTWAKTKILFNAKPEAWSFVEITNDQLRITN
ncbi:MAG: antibiotic biosynthesis monooxygenase [Saprospiraceae bacterium]|jgi:heme-degrading monooxygenase HmoA|nr:antibiotic biosynthesis monooxygenase [Saprospiraceae bacterium]MBK8297777.1 antibiotic biosynthesis monooxygenase [Saprospiraceae bacterium]